MSQRDPARRPGASAPWGRVALLAGSAVVLILIAVGASGVGPWVGRPRTDSIPTFTPPTLPPLPTPTVPHPAPPPSGAAWNPTVLLVILGAVLLAALAVLAAIWWRHRDRTPSRPAKPVEPDQAPPALPPPLDPGLAFDVQRTADEVIRSWQWVEQAAAGAGIARRSQQTPTEFLDGLARAFPIPAGQAALLLRLYHRARFDQVALDASSAGAARSAAEAVCGRLPAARREGVR